MKVKCQTCGTMWDMRELNHHPASQTWANGYLIECPYCVDESANFNLAIASQIHEARTERRGETKT